MRREEYAHHTILVRALSTYGHPRYCGVESGITITPGCQTGRGRRRRRRKRVLRLTARSHAWLRRTPALPPRAIPRATRRWAKGSVSKVEMTTSIVLIYKVLFPSVSTFETPPDHYHSKLHLHFLPAHCGHHLNPIEGFWRVMKDTIGAGRCFGDLQQLYQRTRRVLMAHQERPIYEFHW